MGAKMCQEKVSLRDFIVKTEASQSKALRCPQARPCQRLRIKSTFSRLAVRNELLQTANYRFSY